jgi:hypothetical protein
MTKPTSPKTLPDREDPRVKMIYELLADAEFLPPPGELWEVHAARHIVADLASQPPADPLKPLTELSEELGLHSVQPPAAVPVVPEGWTKERGYHALVQVIYELQNDGSYSDEEGEETHALVDLVLRMEQADAAAPRPPAGQQDRGEAIPEGCTPADAQVLRAANGMLAAENCYFRQALRFYAAGSHFIAHGDGGWDSVSGEPENFLENEEGTATIEDGTIAAMALRGELKDWGDDAPPLCRGEPEDLIVATATDALGNGEGGS